MPNSFEHRFSYNPDGTRDVELECPCGDGYLTVTLNDVGHFVKCVTFGCGPWCEQRYANGSYDDAILAAVAAAQKIEDNGPTERQLESLYDTAGGFDTDHRLSEARKLK